MKIIKTANYEKIKKSETEEEFNAGWDSTIECPNCHKRYDPDNYGVCPHCE